MVSAVAAGMRPHLSDITGGIWEQLLAELGPLRDGGGVGLLQAGMTAQVATLLDVSEYGVPLDTIEGPAAVYEYARRLAQSGRAAAWVWLPLGRPGLLGTAAERGRGRRSLRAGLRREHGAGHRGIPRHAPAGPARTGARRAGEPRLPLHGLCPGRADRHDERERTSRCSPSNT
jgi:hypothetical protein